ncbi:MAG: S41 family peptidase [Maricaulaceae bacterium]
MPAQISKMTKLFTFCFGMTILTACGGGGNSNPAPIIVTPPPPVSTGPTWTAGVFASEGQFKNRCEAPRTGNDPISGDPYPDIAGSTLHENHWQRSWSNNTYLWYNEITDLDPAAYSDRLEYFETLKTSATTSSGTPVDQFHFTIPTEEYQQRVSSGAEIGYGFRTIILASSVPRDIRISYTDPDTPASAPNADVKRGAKILEIDGVDAINDGTQAGVDALNAGLSPENAGETHSFTILDSGSSTPRTVSLTSEVVTSVPVNRTEIIPTSTGNVGYILFNTFGTSIAEEQIVNAMADMSTQNVNDLVIDLRYNGGGFLAISAQLGYMVAGSANTANKTFDSLTFNDKHPVFNPVTGSAISPTPFFDETLGFSLAEGQSLPSLNLNRVFILSTSRTCSASEALINGLRGAGVDVILVGGRTCGKPYGFYATDNCGETYFTIQFRGENDLGFGDYSDGFNPQNAVNPFGELIEGCLMADNYSQQLGAPTEDLLAAALQYREDGTCPAVNTSAKTYEAPNLSKASYEQGDLLSDPRIRQKLMLDTIRIENLPNAK